ncbi:uncharacterized protein YrrD [Desulfitispora alkaliphila]|uniref:PRC-barrel domain-containing protein n=1 Tax=Desulfitispora alkaliphila TaxID=622674 RepID=UPI003D1A218E
MKKGSEILGLPVLEQKAGHKVGKITDLLYSEEQENLLGVLLEVQGDHLPEMRFISCEDITEINAHHISIISEDVLQTPQVLSKAEISGYSVSLAFGQQVFDEVGKEIGIVRDVLVDLETKEVKGYQLSQGLISDLISGRSLLPLNSIVTMGKEMVLVKDFKGSDDEDELSSL